MKIKSMYLIPLWLASMAPAIGMDTMDVTFDVKSVHAGAHPWVQIYDVNGDTTLGPLSVGKHTAKINRPFAPGETPSFYNGDPNVHGTFIGSCPFQDLPPHRHYEYDLSAAAGGSYTCQIPGG
jgi:hypothetical protein